MFQTKREPVTVFSSRDADAPQLSAEAGSLKNVFKACLTDGYGDKQGLGWETHFDDAESAAFRSAAPESNRHFLEVRNPAGRVARVAGYLNMTGINQGEGRFAYGNNYDTLGHLHYAASKGGNWWLIGHKKAFFFFFHDGYDTTDGVIFYFGDVPSIVPHDMGNTVLLHNNGNSQSYSSQTRLQLIGTNGDSFALFAKTWANIETPSKAALVSAVTHFSETPYPDFISGGTMASEIYLYEYEDVAKSARKASLRALLPGIFKAANDLSSIKDGEAVPFDGAEDTFLKFNTDGYGTGHLLVNASYWEAS